MDNLEGKVAFITGGASGIGLGMARVFHAAGMKVIIADIRTDHLESALAYFDDDRSEALLAAVPEEDADPRRIAIEEARPKLKY